MSRRAALSLLLFGLACTERRAPVHPPPPVAATAAASPAPAAAPPPAPEAVSRRIVGPSLFRVGAGAKGWDGTGFGCMIPGLGCTAKHVVGDEKRVRVQSASGRTAEAAVIGVHAEDDVALLDVRALGVPPLAVTYFDLPPDGLVVCRLGYPPSYTTEPFCRCDPTGGMVPESSPRNDSTVLPRLVHLGVGFKGDSGAPIFDPETSLVVGMHVSEANGSGRGTTPSALLDTLSTIQREHRWLRQCPKEDGSELVRRSLVLACDGISGTERADHFRHLGLAMLALGRRGEAFAAFEEALQLEPLFGPTWLLRSLVFPGSTHARDDAAMAFRLELKLRSDNALARIVPPPLLATARALRDEVAPSGFRLATLVGDGGCASCPAFCAAARRAPDVRLWVVEGANHPAAEDMLRKRTGVREVAAPLLAIDGKVAMGCGKLVP